MSQLLSHFFLTLIRHGETVANKTKIIQGQSDTKLSDDGYEQSLQLAKSLDTQKYKLIFSSDLSRAYETCLTIVNGNNEVIKTDVKLRERSFGPIEGKTVDDLKREAINAGVSLKHLSSFTPNGGETLNAVYDRIKQFLNDLIVSIEPKSHVLIVTHGGVIREMIRYFKNDLNCDFNGLEPLIITPNTSVNEFKLFYNNTLIRAECLKLHDINHLNEKAKRIALNQEQVNDQSHDDSQNAL